MKKNSALEIFLSFDVTCFFLCISLEEDTEEGTHIATDGSK